MNIDAILLRAVEPADYNAQDVNCNADRSPEAVQYQPKML
jgi:hypothetical protein